MNIEMFGCPAVCLQFNRREMDLGLFFGSSVKIQEISFIVVNSSQEKTF